MYIHPNRSLKVLHTLNEEKFLKLGENNEIFFMNTINIILI